MKKTLLFLGGVATVGVGAFAVANEMLYRFLIYKEIKVPAGFGKFMSGGVEAPAEKDSYFRRCRLALEDYGYERHYMINERGHKVVGYLVKPEKESKVYVFCSHGYRNEGKREWCSFVEHYVKELGYNMFFVDHQCAGESEGQYVGFSSFESVDAMKWLQYMNETFGEDIQIILHGISMGSTTVMLMTGKETLPENVKFTIADCGFTSPKAILSSVFRSVIHLPAGPTLIGAELFSRLFAGFSLTEKDTRKALKNSKIPVFMVHGMADDFVSCEMTKEGYAACTGEKELLLVEGAGHGVSFLVDRPRYTAEIVKFLEKNVEGKG